MNPISYGEGELKKLRELSATIGRNPLLVQASSGNTSLKLGDVLWIKASGKWLVQADTEDFLVPVKLSRVRRCLAEGTPIPETLEGKPGSFTASIETAMHAVLPQRVVVHVHSVNTIAWAVRADGAREMHARLGGLDWQWIPYTASGMALATQIEQTLARCPKTNVLVLGNHGLVVSGDSCEEAAALLGDVESRLEISPRPTPTEHPVVLEQVLVGQSWTLPSHPSAHALGLDGAAQRILAGGVLYPCQAIFLPGTTPLGQAQTGSLMPRVLPGYGVLCAREMTRADHEMLAGLVSIVQRIHTAAPIHYLSTREVTQILQGSGESYRRVADTNYFSAPAESGGSGTGLASPYSRAR